MKATTRCPAFSAAPAPTSARLRPRRAISRTAGAAFFCAAFAVSVALPLSAHHSFAAEFDASRPVTLEGTVARLEWTNPHAWLYLDVPAAGGGSSVRWALELSAPSALARRGFRPDVASPGTKLVVKGYRAKNGTPRARIWYVTLPDGRSLALTTPEPR
jgi:uncharacterized protein DUF6152